MPVATQPLIVTFGPYEVDFRTGELRKNGLRIRLQQQPFRVLAMLLDRPGELITREELKKKLWTDDVFVDFDHSLNKAVNKLRAALCDTHAPWRYIETVPRRGYKFIAPVQTVTAVAHAAAAGVSNGPAGKPPLTATAAIPALVEQTAGAIPQARVSVWTIYAGLLALSTSLAFLLAVWLLSPRRNTEIRTFPLTSYAGRERHAAISADGEKVAFAWTTSASDDYDLYVKLISGGIPLRLTAVAGEESSPAWSPDNQEIAFYRSVSGGHEVRVIHALGGDERKIALSRAAGSAFGLSWAPTGRTLAIVDRQDTSDPNAIFLLDLPSGQKQRLTSPLASSNGDAFPAFSPDGTEIAFVRVEKGFWNVYVVAADGGQPRQLTDGDRSVGGLAWSADGASIIYATARAGTMRLWRVPAGGGPSEPLPVGGDSARYPSVSRSGARLVYTDYKLDTNIWRAAIGAGETGQPLISSTRLDDSPAYSPDGRRIAFISDRSGFPELWVGDASGAHPAQLTTFKAPLVGSPKWSPDGREIAFDVRARGDLDIYVVNADSGVLRQLTSDESQESTPNWSRDGRWIYFARRHGRAPSEIFKAPSHGGLPVQVTRNGGFECAESFDGHTLYFSKPTVPGLWWMPLAGGEERPITQIPPIAGRRYWTVSRSGIYFVPQGYAPLPIQFFSFKTGKITQVGRMERDAVGGPPGLAISPDERWILFAQIDRRDSDITLVENFQ